MSSVLVIDDDEHARSSAKAALDSAGFTSTLTGSGDDGLEKFEMEKFDLVICDALMRGKSGLQTIAAIRKSAPDLPIIAMRPAHLPAAARPSPGRRPWARVAHCPSRFHETTCFRQSETAS
jgi:CheY-like chemotaxis protein